MMDIEVTGKKKDALEFEDINRAILHRGQEEIEIRHSDEGIQVFQNPEEDLKTSPD